MNGTVRVRNQRGTATIEAILALSVFIIVWVGVLYMGRAYSAKLELKSKVRACAWLQSVNSCSVEVDCGTSVGDGNMDEDEGGLLDKFEVGGELGKLLTDILENQVKKLFGERATVAASYDFARPVHLGGEQVSVSASYSLPCNTKPVSTDTLPEQLLELLKEKVFSP